MWKALGLVLMMSTPAAARAGDACPVMQVMLSERLKYADEAAQRANSCMEDGSDWKYCRDDVEYAAERAASAKAFMRRVEEACVFSARR